jgi:type III pantothenate kinase
MILLLDIGNTNTHLGMGDSKRVLRHIHVPTSAWETPKMKAALKVFPGKAGLKGVALCSVVPRATTVAVRMINHVWNLPCLELTPRTLKGLGIDYPKPNTIGPDRLANALSVCHHYGQPSVAVDFGTAVTFDVVNESGNFVGGIIAPGLSAMTDYLHEKTALLPKIKLRATKSVIGKSTKQAMMAGAVNGYLGLVRTLLKELKQELGTKRLPVIATGGYAKLIAANVKEITAVEPLLTLEGLRLLWCANYSVLSKTQGRPPALPGIQC